jgi:hypothetical protein
MGAGKPDRLPEEVLRNIQTSDNEVYFSAVSIWEIAIKTSLGRANFPYSPEQIAQAAQETGFIVVCYFRPCRQNYRAALVSSRSFRSIVNCADAPMPARLLTADSTLTPVLGIGVAHLTSKLQSAMAKKAEFGEVGKSG